MNGTDGPPNGIANEEQEHLLAYDVEMTDMARLDSAQSNDKGQPHVETRYQYEETIHGELSGHSAPDEIIMPTGERPIEYKVYKRRWFGLVQLVLLNIVVSWDVSISMHQKQTTPPLNND